LKRSLLFFIVFIRLNLVFVCAQSYTYLDYNTKDGLASSVVYDICQDRDGFIWFATESGVSRFDGTRFKNFTFEDGLSTNAILTLFADSKGRVWMSGLDNSVCYYYQGRIYNTKNDSLLSHTHIDNTIFQFAEDSDGNVLICVARKKLLFFPASGNRQPTWLSPPLVKDFVIATNYPKKGFLVGNNDSIFNLTDTVMQFWRMGIQDDDKTISIISSINEWQLPRPNNTKTLYVLRGRPRFINTSAGAWEIDTLNGQLREVLLPGKNINRTLIDNENNIWFATAGEGIYRLVSKEYKTWTFQDRSPVFSITDWKGDILAGSEFSRLYRIRNTSIDSLVLFPGMTSLDQASGNRQNKGFLHNRAYAIKKLKNGDLLIGFDHFLALLTKENKLLVKGSESVKSICQVNEDTVMIGTSHYAALFDYHNLTLIKKFWNRRATAVHYINGYYYIGTVEGLYSGRHIDSLSFLGIAIPEAASLISCMVDGGNGLTWMATQAHGVIGIKEDRLITHFSKLDGLSSNICKAIYLAGNKLWVATDKGLNVIDLDRKGNSITTYTTADGLPFNNIDAVYVLDDKVYVGSPAGLTSFKPGNKDRYTPCQLKLLDIVLGDSSMIISPTYTTRYNKNNLKISYTGISYKSGGDIIYYYRMKGLVGSWDSTYQTTLEFPSIPPGEYEFELVAKNRFGVRSEPLVFSLIVKSPFWQKTWFIISSLVFLAVIGWWITIMRFRRLRRKEWEKIRVQQKISDLEQRAQRAQMNPHFIFNCLNSIQNFIIQNDIETTNQYLTEFAGLIRQTLDNSDKKSITIKNEIRYLSNYLELEKMRFVHRFNFHIEVDKGINTDDVQLPVMFLQPYIENSVHHGLRHRKDDQGIVRIQFQQNETYLTCIVEDNGVGRTRAMAFKSSFDPVHLSKGTVLNMERMSTLNQYYDEKMTIETIDIYNGRNEAAGTRVVIHFPISLLDKLESV
jgi:ligand-binding sensor domain-containing protein